MTLVNTETGELLDVETAEQRASYICTDLDSAADSFESAMGRMREAIQQRDDIVLGYRSPGDYLSDRFGGRLARLGVDLRREVVRELTEAGLSTRAIAPVVGVNNATVHRDLSRVAPATPDPTPSPAPPVADEGQTPQGEVTPTAPPAPVVETATPRPAVTGIDGKTYTRPAPTPKPERSGEQQNAEENSRTLASALIFLLAFQHPNQRDTARGEWEAGRWAVSPTNRAYVTPNHMREAARGLTDLADEWENQ